MANTKKKLKGTIPTESKSDGKTIVTYTNSQANSLANKQSTLTLNFNLNEIKALLKKQEAVTRPDFTYRVTGGGHVLQMSTGAYECIKRNLLDFYQSLGESVQITYKVDQGENIIDVSVTHFAKKSRGPKQKLYKANFYNTTSRALINGKKPEMFYALLTETSKGITKDDLETINDIVSSVNIPEQAELTRKSNRSRKPTEKVLDNEKSLKEKQSKTQLHILEKTDTNIDKDGKANHALDIFNPHDAFSVSNGSNSKNNQHQDDTQSGASSSTKTSSLTTQNMQTSIQINGKVKEPENQLVPLSSAQQVIHIPQDIIRSTPVSESDVVPRYHISLSHSNVVIPRETQQASTPTMPPPAAAPTLRVTLNYDRNHYRTPRRNQTRHTIRVHVSAYYSTIGKR